MDIILLTITCLFVPVSVALITSLHYRLNKEKEKRESLEKKIKIKDKNLTQLFDSIEKRSQVTRRQYNGAIYN